MGAAFARSKLQGREKRLGTLSAYWGTAHSLLTEVKDRQNIRTFSQAAFDEIIYALEVLGDIEDSVTVIHGPSGCGTIKIYYGEENAAANWYSTNLNERDTILGGDEKLRETIVSAYKKHRPKIIFIVATPVVAINNDDINSVVLELEKELTVKIVPVFTDGFNSKTAINGYDLVLNAIGKYLLKGEVKAQPDNFLNLVTLSENNANIKEILLLLKKLKIETQLVPRFTSYEQIKNSLRARASVALNHDEGYLLGKGLAEKYEVPYLKTPIPIGFENTAVWLQTVAAAFHKTGKVQAIINKESADHKQLIEKKQLFGLKIYIDLKASLAIALVPLLQELGGEIVGITVDEIDEINKNSLVVLPENLPVQIASGQPFELANILNKIKPDLYIGEKEKSSWVAKLGITALSIDRTAIYGFNGSRNLLIVIGKARGNKKLMQQISHSGNPYYKNTWLQKSTNWHIKQEVK